MHNRLRAMVSLGFVVVLIGTGAVASAQTDPTALLTSATTLQQAGEHEAARVLLREAYTRTPTPRIAGQLAISELAVGRHREAELHFTEALRSTDAWIVAHRTELVDGLARAAAELGTIDTSRVPAGTEIRVGDEVLGHAPAPIRTNAGLVRLDLRMPSGSITAVVQVTAGQTLSLAAPPAPGVASAQPSGSIAVTAPPATAFRFPDSFRARFAPRGRPRAPVRGTRWITPAWALDTDLVLATRLGFALSPRTSVLDPGTSCGNEQGILVPRLAVAFGIQHGFDLSVVLVARGWADLEPFSGCDTETLTDDPTYDTVIRQRDGWLLGLGGEVAVRVTPGRAWYLGVGTNVGVGLFVHSADETWIDRESSDYLGDPATSSGTRAELLWKLYAEGGGTFGDEHDWSAGVRLGGGMPDLFFAEVELVIPIGGL